MQRVKSNHCVIIDNGTQSGLITWKYLVRNLIDTIRRQIGAH